MSWLETGTDRYLAAGVTGNPFAWDAQGGDRGPVIDRLLTSGVDVRASQRRVIELVGVRGAGKTTQLHEWRRRLPGPYHYVAPGPARLRWKRPPIGPVVYWDEVDRLPRPLLRLALRSAHRSLATVVMGTHRSLAADARRAGLSVLTLEFGPLDHAELARWARGRIAEVSVTARTVVVPDGVLDEVAKASGGSLRVAGDLLHRWFANHVAGLPSVPAAAQAS